MQMTVITSYPSVDFTYTGGFHYVPPSAEPSASQFAGEA